MRRRWTRSGPGPPRSNQPNPHIHRALLAHSSPNPVRVTWRATSPGLVPPQCVPARAGAVGGGGADRSGHRRVRPVLHPHEAAQRGKQHTRVRTHAPAALVLRMQCQPVAEWLRVS